jgi:hypothetical protein
MIECLTNEKLVEEIYASCMPCPVDAPTCDPHVPTCDPNLSDN